MKRGALAGMVLFLSGYALPHATARTPLHVVESVDLTRYSGTWYEIARLPNTYQGHCAGNVTATYTLLENGEMKVVNRCMRRDGTFSAVEGRARRASPDGPATKLEVRFAPALLSFLPFVWGDYWIIDLAEDYSHAVIGEPRRNSLWVLGRSPVMAQHTLEGILRRAGSQGYNLATLIRTSHTIEVP